MPNYTYTARDRTGTVTNGTIFAESDAELRALLRTNDLFLTKYKSRVDSATAQQQSIFRPRKVKLEDMVIMSRQLATLVRAGLPIVEALSTVALQSENVLLTEALNDVRISVVAGANLADAMRKHPKIFNELYCSLVEAGETGGILDQTLEVAAAQFDKDAVLREQVKAAMTYPKIVLVASMGVVAFMLVVIVPGFGKVYQQFNSELPFMTRLLMSSSDFVLKFWWMVGLGGVALLLGFKAYKGSPQGRRNLDRLSLQLPVLGRVLRKIAIARFTQTLGGAVTGGIPILRSLAVSANTAGNVVIKDAIMQVASQVQEGTPLASPLDNTGEFPPLVIRMIAAGEKSGNLSFMLDEVTKYYQRDVDYSIGKMTRMLEPIMTVIVGCIVLFVLLALYMPVFNLGNVVKR